MYCLFLNRFYKETMKKIILSSEFFNIVDTLECGQVFRFKPFEKGFLSFSLDKCAYCYTDGANTVIECEEKDKEYFENYFDIFRDYSKIYNSAIAENVEILSKSATVGRGIRILNQDPVEALFSFVVSQNNNIPRIKGIIERLCEGLGEQKGFGKIKYYAFPSVEKMANAPLDFYKNIGLGYRAEYIKRLAQEIKNGLSIYGFKEYQTIELKKKLIALHGVGPKVADCALLFGFHRSDAFPVDTWIEKVYIEDFGGSITNREKQAEYFVSRFKENSGYYQQYLFHYKRIVEKNREKAQKDDKN